MFRDPARPLRPRSPSKRRYRNGRPRSAIGSRSIGEAVRAPALRLHGLEPDCEGCRPIRTGRSLNRRAGRSRLGLGLGLRWRNASRSGSRSLTAYAMSWREPANCQPTLDAPNQPSPAPLSICRRWPSRQSGPPRLCLVSGARICRRTSTLLSCHCATRRSAEYRPVGTSTIFQDEITVRATAVGSLALGCGMRRDPRGGCCQRATRDRRRVAWLLATPSEIVVTRAVGPGRDAAHRKKSFVPHHAFHVAEIAGHYERSAGIEAYLGDWHTHPGATIGTPSSKDRFAVKRIAADPEARAPKALTMIVAGEGCSWEPSLWVGCVEPLFALWTRLRLTPCIVRHCA